MGVRGFILKLAVGQYLYVRTSKARTFVLVTAYLGDITLHEALHGCTRLHFEAGCGARGMRL